jgi:DNA-directed RNA polymerase specialized sigma24 family protein
MAAPSFDTSNFEQAQVAFKGTIRTFARNCVHQLPGFAQEDIEQELLMVLWLCVQKYDPNKGASFNTLFQGCARNKVISLVRSAQTQKRKALWVNLDAEAVAAEVEMRMSVGSAERSYLALEEIRERLAG